MIKYSFKLEALLTLRKNEEEKIKVQLGLINKEIFQIEETIKKQHEDIDQGYTSQEALLKNGVEGKMLGFYPYFTEGKKAFIEKLETQMWSARRRYFEKLEELKVMRGRVKVIEKLREKDFTKFRKEQLKEEDKKNEDLVRMWTLSQN